MTKKQAMTLKPGGNNSDAKSKALEIVSGIEDFLGTNTHPARVDIDKKVWRVLQDLKNSTEKEDGKSVSGRMLITEAFLDLFEKYKSGNGKYQFESDNDFERFLSALELLFQNK